MSRFVRDTLQSFPYNGKFQRWGVNEDLPPIEQVEERLDVFEGSVDIQQANIGSSPILSKASYKIFFELPKEKLSVDGGKDIEVLKMLIQNGDSFVGETYGKKVNGKVLGTYVSQKGFGVVLIEDIDA